VSALRAVGPPSVGRVTGPDTVRDSVRDSVRDPLHGDFATSLERLLDRPAPAPALAPVPAQEPAASAARSPVQFSRHAAARLTSRGIEIGPEELERLGSAIDRLEESGARESLVLLGDNAYVVGVPTRTVITAMPRSEALGTVFTRIDSTFVAS
jgi:flagellar operon protein